MGDSGAIAELERCAGTQFDSDVISALVTVLARRPVATAGVALVDDQRH